MTYTMTSPCDECPFLTKYENGYTMKQLVGHASGEFACHKSTNLIEVDGVNEYTPTEKSVHCTGALIFLEKRKKPHQMMRICERLGFYDHRKLNMEAEVR